MWRVAVVAFVLAGCGGTSQTLVVGVASSMAETGTDLARAYETRPVEISVAGSQVLVAQIREGAPLDVVVTADARTAYAIASLPAAAGEPALVARNRLTIAVAEGNPLGIRSLSDLESSDLALVLAAPEVPAGNYTQQLLARAGVLLTPDSFEPSVRGVLAKVRLGEADAGIVYQTDVLLGGADPVPIEGASDVAVEYYAVPLTSGGDPVKARAFVDWLQSTAAATIFDDHGFGR